MVLMYFSGAENTLHYLNHVYEMGHNIRGLMLTFLKIKANTTEIERAKYLRRFAKKSMSLGIFDNPTTLPLDGIYAIDALMRMGAKW